MRKVITYGTYDLLHQGHINLLQRAKALGDYLIVGVTSDNFDKERGKLNVHNNVLERIEAVRRTGYADEIVIEDYVGQKIDDIQRFGVDIFAIGSAWEGHFDYLREFCQVVYLPRTEGISSTQLREEFQEEIKIGIIGTGRIAQRFVPEASNVGGARIVAVYNPFYDEAIAFASRYSIEKATDNLLSFFQELDAVYIASPHLTHYDYIYKALTAGKHVLCEIPMVLKKNDAELLYSLAENKKLVLLEASKTAHCPAWNHLLVLVKSGIIGEIVDVKASLSKLVNGNVRELDALQAGGCMTELASFPLMAIVKLLGTDIKEVRFYSKLQDGVDIFTKGNIVYRQATASVTLGLGVKTEGNLVISGTCGYILVPSPWWLTNYFEVRYEDQNQNKKYFYAFQGDGLRYELQEFLSMIFTHRLSSYRFGRKESVAIAGMIELYREGTNNTYLE